MIERHKFNYKRLEAALALDEMMQEEAWNEADRKGLTRKGILATINPGISGILIQGKSHRDEVAADGIAIGRELIRLRGEIEELKQGCIASAEAAEANSHLAHNAEALEAIAIADHGTAEALTRILEGGNHEEHK